MCVCMTLCVCVHACVRECDLSLDITHNYEMLLFVNCVNASIKLHIINSSM